ncbi:hypothetical protein HPB50_000737 [Hyalomma asiaticum]|uniref:Uncharacterized protein n=1 Tax=Hyalomma asiaticum TaxID=266040 RepID=A0ACB7SS74_HYAAI|nr:hypothetical protein HPB50_000737 [Hyalomma asiaticum]
MRVQSRRQSVKRGLPTAKRRRLFDGVRQYSRDRSPGLRRARTLPVGSWRDGLVVFSEERDDTGAAESPWPIFKNVVCGVAVTALGALTLGAFLTSKS